MTTMRIRLKSVTIHIVYEPGAIGRGHFYSIWRHVPSTGENLLVDTHKDYAVAQQSAALYRLRAAGRA